MWFWSRAGLAMPPPVSSSQRQGHMSLNTAPKHMNSWIHWKYLKCHGFLREIWRISFTEVLKVEGPRCGLSA